jgi:hypothetical protein
MQAAVQQAPAPQPAVIPKPEIKPQKPEPRLLYGIINEGFFDVAFDRWMLENGREPNKDEIIECRYNDRDETLQFAIVRVGRENAITRDENIEEFYYYYEDNHDQYTVRIIPPQSKAA